MSSKQTIESSCGKLYNMQCAHQCVHLQLTCAITQLYAHYIFQYAFGFADFAIDSCVQLDLLVGVHFGTSNVESANHFQIMFRLNNKNIGIRQILSKTKISLYNIQ